MIAALNLPRVFRFLFNLFWIDMTLLVTYRHGRPLGCQPQPLLRPASSTWLSGDVRRSSMCSAQSTSLLISAHGCRLALFAGQWSPGILRCCRITTNALEMLRIFYTTCLILFFSWNTVLVFSKYCRLTNLLSPSATLWQGWSSPLSIVVGVTCCPNFRKHHTGSLSS